MVYDPIIDGMIIHTDNIDYPYGYWEVSGKKYTNKLRAVTDAVPKGWWPNFNFHEERFSRHNWTQEPAQSLKELYRERCKNLRERYDFLTLEFSGGADSWNILYNFVHGGIHLDCVVHRYVDAVTRGRNDRSVINQPAEAVYQAWPWFEEFRKINPHLKWKTQYLTDPIINGWKSHHLDPFEYNNLHVGFITKMPDISMDLFDYLPNDRSCANIHGIDKPNLFFEDNKFFLYFSESQIAARGVYERNQNGIKTQDVLFYYDPDCANLLAKQAHIVMNWFKKHPEFLYLISNRHHRDNSIYYKIVNELIYPEYREIWQSEKPKGLHIMSHESWFHDNSIDTKHGDNWRKSLKILNDVVLDTMKGTKFESWIKGDGQYHWLPDTWSKFYYIGSI